MKITNTAKGQAYHLTPGTQLEIERTNLFFNEYGEQSLPIDLPDTDRNRDILGYPDQLGNRNKPAAPIECTIEHDGYFSVARQVILSAKRKEGISTSFYINEGSFLSKLQNTNLKDVFGDETIPGITTVDEALSWCRSLFDNRHPDYAIFQIAVDDGEMQSLSSEDRTWALSYVNRIALLNENGTGDSNPEKLHYELYNAWKRSIKQNGNIVTVPAGAYITPFMRTNYLLKRIFAYFGYELQENFFTRTEPFSSMVLLNNTCDTLLNGTIRLTDLIPDTTCSTILEVFRKRFLCEFIPDEATHQVEIKLLNELLDEAPSADLTNLIDGNIEIEYPEEYQEIKLSSANTLSAGTNPPCESGAADLLKKYPNVRISPIYGAFINDGYSGIAIASSTTRPYTSKIVSSSCTPYNANSGLNTLDIQVPDMQPEFRNAEGDEVKSYLCVGKSRWMNSAILDYGQSQESAQDEIIITSDEESLYPMLAFCYAEDKYTMGTITEYKNIPTIGKDLEAVRFSDYSLLFNGKRGIFETFYRRYDDILRNSFHRLHANMLLPAELKVGLSPHTPVVIDGQKVLPNIIRYTIGQTDLPEECEFYTCKVHDPQTHADRNTSLSLEDRRYVWKAFLDLKTCSESEYNDSEYKDKYMETVYPRELPTADMVGRKFYERSWCTYSEQNKLYFRYDFYMMIVRIDQA